MPDFAALIPETYSSISPGYVETLIHERREQLFTGLMRINPSTGGPLVFSFLEGNQQRLYRCGHTSVDILPRHTWFETITHSDSTVGFLSLPVEALRFVRVAHEAPVTRVEKASFQPKELNSVAGKWVLEGEPGIVHLCNENLNRYYLISGHSTPILEELSIEGGRVSFSLNDASFAHRLPDSTYEVVRHVSACEHEVWREYELRLAFNPLIRMLLTRFGELAGRVLTERLCQQLSLSTREAGWNITITANGAVNRQYFDSLESAVNVYADVLRRFRESASPAIGARMVDGITRDIMTKLDPYRRELLTQFLYSQPGVAGLSGVVWR